MGFGNLGVWQRMKCLRYNAHPCPTPTIMSPPLSIIGSWLTLFAATLDSYGIDSQAFLRERGVDYSRQSDPEHRIPLATMSSLWDDAAAITRDSAFGIKAGQFVTPTTFSALGIALWSSCSIKDLVICWCRYLHVFSTVADMELEETDTEIIMTCTLNTHSGSEKASLHAMDATLSALLHICKQHYGGDITPNSVSFTRPKPHNIDAYHAIFGSTLKFDQPRIEVRLDRATSEQQIPGGNPSLAKATEQLVADYLQKMQAPSLIRDVQQVLFELWPRGDAKLDVVAERLHVSPRTLHRKLEDAGSNFRQQQESTRHQLALQFIRQAHLSVTEIGYLLGFSNTSNFSRAFKRWTGYSPQEFRERQRTPH